MRAVIQRVTEASVEVDGAIRASVGPGLLVLLGVQKGDGPADVQLMARKIPALRIFSDEQGKMNRSVQDVRGEVLVVSQFTLCADLRRGNRPGFDDAMPPDAATRMVDEVVAALAAQLPQPPRTGVFGAHMKVRLLNDGPVTIVLDSRPDTQP